MHPHKSPSQPNPPLFPSRLNKQLSIHAQDGFYSDRSFTIRSLLYPQDSIKSSTEFWAKETVNPSDIRARINSCLQNYTNTAQCNYLSADVACHLFHLTFCSVNPTLRPQGELLMASFHRTQVAAFQMHLHMVTHLGTWGRRMGCF